MIFETDRGIFLGAQAHLVMPERVTAEWTHRSITPNDAFLYMAAKYVEADRPNSNGHLWSFEDLKAAQASIVNSPINMMHQPHNIIGVMIDQEIMYPNAVATSSTSQSGAFTTTSTTNTLITYDAAKAYDHQNPYIEVLGALWKFYFPKTVEQVQALHETGSLYVSMECISDTVTRVDSDGSEQEYPFKGGNLKEYDFTDKSKYVRLNKPHFVGCGLVLPPAKPGWKGADVRDLLAASKQDPGEMYEQIAEEMPHLGPREWESLMISLLLQRS